MSKRINPHRRLGEEEIYNIVHYLAKTKLSQEDISRLLDIHPRLISHIKKGEIYRDIVDDKMVLIMNGGKVKNHRRLSESEITTIQKMIKQKTKKQKEIAEMFQIDPSTVTRIKQSIPIQ